MFTLVVTVVILAVIGVLFLWKTGAGGDMQNTMTMQTSEIDYGHDDVVQAARMQQQF